MMNDANPQEKKSRNPLVYFLGGCLVMFACLACLGVVVVAGGFFVMSQSEGDFLDLFETPEAVAVATAVPTSPPPPTRTTQPTPDAGLGTPPQLARTHPPNPAAVSKTGDQPEPHRLRL